MKTILNELSCIMISISLFTQSCHQSIESPTKGRHHFWWFIHLLLNPETCLAAFNNNTENSETTFIVSLSLMFKRIYKKGMILEFFNSYLWTVWIIEVGFVKRSKNLNLDSSKLHRLFKMLTLHIWDIEQYTRMSIHIACSYLLFRPYSSCNIMF